MKEFTELLNELGKRGIEIELSTSSYPQGTYQYELRLSFPYEQKDKFYEFYRKAQSDSYGEVHITEDKDHSLFFCWGEDLYILEGEE